MTRPPHAASSVVGYASDTASAVAKVEPNSNRSRETGRPYCAWYFTMCFVKFESTVITFDSGVVGLEINVWYCFWKCEKLVFVPLQKFSATSQTLSLRNPDSATSDPLVAQRLWVAGPRARSLWVAFRQDCQYDSLSIDKCSKIGHRGPRYEEMLTNEKFIMKKKYFCVPHYFVL